MTVIQPPRFSWAPRSRPVNLINPSSPDTPREIYDAVSDHIGFFLGWTAAGISCFVIMTVALLWPMYRHPKERRPTILVLMLSCALYTISYGIANDMYTCFEKHKGESVRDPALIIGMLLFYAALSAMFHAFLQGLGGLTSAVHAWWMFIPGIVLVSLVGSQTSVTNDALPIIFDFFGIGTALYLFFVARVALMIDEEDLWARWTKFFVSPLLTLSFITAAITDITTVHLTTWSTQDLQKVQSSGEIWMLLWGVSTAICCCLQVTYFWKMIKVINKPPMVQPRKDIEYATQNQAGSKRG